MTTQIEAVPREAALIEDAHVRPMMGPDVLEPLPSARIPYRTVDPFILVHEAVVPITRSAGVSDRDHNRRSNQMATYRMVYGDDEQVVRETLENIDDLQREDGWVVFFRGKEAILRVQEQHVQSLEELDG